MSATIIIACCLDASDCVALDWFAYLRIEGGDLSILAGPAEMRAAVAVIVEETATPVTPVAEFDVFEQSPSDYFICKLLDMCFEGTRP